MERWCWTWNGYMEPAREPAEAYAVSAAAVWCDSAGWIGVGS